jgi:hypothetical protein
MVLTVTDSVGGSIHSHLARKGKCRCRRRRRTRVCKNFQAYARSALGNDCSSCSAAGKNFPYAFTEAHVLQNIKPTTTAADKAKLRENKFSKKTVYEHFFGSGQSVAQALQNMANEKIFGVDCVGFVSQDMSKLYRWAAS